MKVAELEGAVLDYWVGCAEGLKLLRIGQDGASYVTVSLDVEMRARYSPSTNWAQGGPLIERERISIKQDAGGGCYAYFDHRNETAAGDTLLIAAMRAYVKSKFGEKVEDIDAPPERAD